MRLVLVTIITVAVLVMVPIIGGKVLTLNNESAASRVTVIYKNQSSPTLEELGQKAGDPSNAGAPQTEPVFNPHPKAQWI